MAGAHSGQRRQRISDEPGFLSHRVAWRETSLILDVFTRHHGRVALIAKGARRPRSELRPVLLAFQPLRLAWMGRGELQTLTGAEWVGGIEAPQAQALICGFYLNELLIRLLPRDDAHPQLYDAYLQATIELTELDASEHEECLRRFEWTLLRESGYAPDLELDCDGLRIDGQARYRWVPELGFQRLELSRSEQADCSDDQQDWLEGYSLQALAQGVLEHARQRQQAKRLTRRILGHCLEGRELYTRKMLFDLHAMTQSLGISEQVFAISEKTAWLNLA